MIVKALRWAYGDSLKYMAFLLGVAAFVGFLMTLIAYPIQTIATVVIGLGVWALFNLFSEWG